MIATSYVWCGFCVANSYQSKFFAYQSTCKKDYAQNKIEKYLKHDSAVEDYFLLTDKAFYMFASGADKIKNNPEFVLNFGDNTRPTRKVVAGKLRVAIDPGHLGGDMAEIEERCIDLSLPDGTHIKFDEGTLAVFTAKILKTYLESIGAEVLLTKNSPGQAACSISFSDWCAKKFAITVEADWFDSCKQQKVIAYLSMLAPKFNLLKNENPEQRLRSIADSKNSHEKVLALKKALFRLCYNRLDLKARVDKINKFKPDLTIVIHFNASGGAHDVSKANYNLVFISGSFLAGELCAQRFREEFVRLLVTDDLENSLLLSQAVIEKMETQLGCAIMKNEWYQMNCALCVDDGIYCRNLALTRGVHSPICYGETFIQNNIEEAKKLAKKNFEFEGQLISSRLVDVAQAYFYGICQYLKLVTNC